MDTNTTVAPLTVKAKWPRPKSEAATQAYVRRYCEGQEDSPSCCQVRHDSKSIRKGTKRNAAYRALTRPEGCTIAQSVEFLKWAPSVCGSEFRECARITKRKLVREGNVYRLA